MGTPTATKHLNLVKRMLSGLLAVLAFSSAARAGSWWDAEWTIRKKITVATTGKGAAISEPIGTTAVLIRLHDANFQFLSSKEDGTDIRFVAADDKTTLPLHIEKFDPVLNEAFVWVKVPDVKPGAELSFFLYYGSNGPKALKADDIKGTYPSETVLVYHFSDKGAAPVDASGNNNNAERAALPVEGAMIGGGARLDGKNPLTIPASPSLLWTDGGAMTWSAWVKPGALEADAILLSRRDGSKSFAIGLNNGVPFVEVSGKQAAAGAPIAPASWHHLAAICGGGQITLYLDGEQCTALGAALPAMNAPILVGGDTQAGATGFSGEIDELQISRVARPVGFIQAAAFGQGGDKASKLLIFGEDEQQANWLNWLTTGYFGVIIKNLTADGWAVIIILAIMAVISWYVMVSKVRYLNGIATGNHLFMNAWRHVASDLTVLDDEDPEKSKSLGGRVTKENIKRLRRSSVYRIYHIGVEEIRHRLGEDRLAGVRRGLAGRSIQAIRAALDGGLVRETQKINKLIVLLTICISGGPFLGLLGTVVGVMITFAAVAAAGEVNVNAIAPGIAAALLATVAGLAVAIPALFGYNYILSRVKDAKDDMHIFIDEFVTKMAEFYKERND